MFAKPRQVWPLNGQPAGSHPAPLPRAKDRFAVAHNEDYGGLKSCLLEIILYSIRRGFRQRTLVHRGDKPGNESELSWLHPDRFAYFPNRGDDRIRPEERNHMRAVLYDDLFAAR